ncbi:MAG: mandelate racemase/muconate lactonizing enzyme family protein [Alphaproteobacteria bacterium]|nr:mandelate racemase/muconate lactonizing enzyme family protein [Alphaproteobacteria bacterium]
MRIAAVHDIVAPIKSAIRNAFIDFSAMTASVVAVVTDQVVDGRPVVGFGFNSNGRYAASGLLRERFIPRLLAARPETLVDDSGSNLDPQRIWSALMANEKPGGHGERSVAVGVLDMAVWDAVAKIARVPLWRLLADRYRGGEADPHAWVYAAGGYYYPDKDVGQLQAEMRSYLDRGYSTVKMKIGGVPLAQDLRRIEAVLEIVGTGDRLCVDVNGRYTLAEALACADALAPLGLRWYEEPIDPLDYLMHAPIAARYPGAIATGENLFSMQDARNLIRHAGLRPDRDVLQFDPALSYGLVEYLRTLDMLKAHGWSPRRCVPHGGHQFALNIAVGLGLGGNESYPDVFRPFGGFADDIPVVDSRVRMPDVPGIGFEAKNELFAVMKPLLDR